jgi:hypothetical protein
MENSIHIASRFKEVILNGKWIANTNYKDQLSGVTWKQATTKIGSLNTIAALAFHINYYIEGIVHFFESGKLEIRDKYSFDMPKITSQEDWENLLNSMWTNAEKMTSYIEELSKERLEADFVDKRYGSYRRNIEGMIEHSYYHLGQISLIKKMIMESDRP